MSRNPVQVRAVGFGSDRTVVIAPLLAADLDGLRAAVGELVAAPVDVIEWRADHLLAADGTADLERAVGIAREAAGERPLLVTLRTLREGGELDLAPDAALAVQRRLLATGEIDLLDVEVFADPATAPIAIAAAREAGARVIGSRHHVDVTPPPARMSATLREMAEVGVDIAKLAVMPRTPADVLSLLQVTREASDELRIPVITMSMGALGTISRLAGPVTGSAATFASVGADSAPGQLPLELVREILRRSGENPG